MKEQKEEEEVDCDGYDHGEILPGQQNMDNNRSFSLSCQLDIQ